MRYRLNIYIAICVFVIGSFLFPVELFYIASHKGLDTLRPMARALSRSSDRLEDTRKSSSAGLLVEWVTIIETPGQFGSKKAMIHKELDRLYGIGSWRVAWQLGNIIISKEQALQEYEDAYYQYLLDHPDRLEWLVANASDVYDNSITNIKAGPDRFDYTKQESSRGVHIQDIAVRRVVCLRFNRKFEGERAIALRGHSLGESGNRWSLDPGIVPFHKPELIVPIEFEGWWQPGTIEAFYQQCRVIQVRQSPYLQSITPPSFKLGKTGVIKKIRRGTAMAFESCA